MSKPNIIIINPDEMRADAMGHMGNSAAYTPNLDRFAEGDAVSFARAYCQNTVCVPSRCSFLTGLYPHVHGHRTMRHLLRENETSLFKELKNAGYHVWMNARNDLVAGQIPGLVQSHADEIFYGDAVKQPKSVGMYEELWRKYPYSHFCGAMEDGAVTAVNKDMADTQAAVRRISSWPGDQPLCLFLGWQNPHPPYAAPLEDYKKISRNLLPERIRLEESRGQSLMIHKIHELAGLADLSEDMWDELRAVYLAQCTRVDTMFGMVCDALKEMGMYDNSAIFVLSDHGDFTGDYGLPEKAQNTFEDCLTRVPLLIKPPGGCGVDPGITTGLAELVDFYATAMDYADVRPEHDHFGRSLRPVIEDRNATVREYVCCEGGRMDYELQCDEYHAAGPEGPDASSPYWPKMNAQFDPLAHEKGTMIFDGRYKYVERPSGNNELYDLTEDPGERINIYPERKDTPLVQDFCRKLLNWYQTTCDIVPRDYDNRWDAMGIWTMIKGMCPAEHADAVREFIFSGGNMNDIRKLF